MKAPLFFLVLSCFIVMLIILGCEANDAELATGESEETEVVAEEESGFEPEKEPDLEGDSDHQQETKLKTEAYVDVDFLRLRSGPSNDHDILDRLMIGTLLQVVESESESEWIQVVTPDGKRGWVHSGFVIIQNSIPDDTKHKMSKDVEERIKNCKIMRLFNMSFEEITNILGEPDETIWLSGEVYVWNDASVLIENNEDGLSEQKELLIGGESIKAIDFKEFGVIKIGMSFHDAKEILGDDLKVYGTEGSEWFQYAMVYEYEDYSIIFEGMDSKSPIRMIMVWRF